MGEGGIVGRPTQTRFGRVGAGGGNPADRGGFPQQVNDLIVCRNGSASQPTFNRLWLRDYPVRAGNPGFPLWVKSRRGRGKIRYLSERVNHVG